MRVLRLLTILLTLILTSQAHAWTVVASSCGNTFGGGNAATTGAIDTSGADLIVLYGTMYNPTFGAIAFSDSETNTWALLTQQATSDRLTRLAYVFNPITDVSHTFTTQHDDGAGATFEPAVCAVAFSGAQTSSDPFDQQNGATGTSTTVQQPGSITPTTNGQLIVSGGFSKDEDFSTPAVDSGFTLQDSTASRFGIAYLVQGSAGAINPTWSTDFAATAFHASIASFKSVAPSGHHKVSVIVVE